MAMSRDAADVLGWWVGRGDWVSADEFIDVKEEKGVKEKWCMQPASRSDVPVRYGTKA